MLCEMNKPKRTDVFQPGTYDSLSYMHFSPPPTSGASGGPIVDEETGAVVGVVQGSMMVNRVQGQLGWGTPSEAIFEVCPNALPGEPKNKMKNSGCRCLVCLV